MASLSSSSVATMSRTIPTQATMAAPFTGLKSNVAFPVTKKEKSDFSSLPSNGGRVQCMKVWPPLGKKKFETLSYLPPLTDAQLAKEVDYLLRNNWVPCLEFEVEHGFVYRENHRSPGYYDGRTWTMWKLPMFGCTDSAQVLKELQEAKKEYPNAFIRIIGFDNVRQVQCISFIAHKPPGY
ncbi:Ribulose-1,5-bisphosphate carboxylase small subunit, N-terminal [Artemisia annua]|uniref:Ribulose bisphosphate carboxylase small subunit, chloroplastic n=1 Tax=Artemisia annua TaxID=35608 RepID=A0A2U1QP02_ARTAN|nr:Ribulose-1,5-bisphosphate carboxylase small subunit, N-terminal [Artemisia annua]